MLDWFCRSIANQLTTTSEDVVRFEHPLKNILNGSENKRFSLLSLQMCKPIPGRDTLGPEHHFSQTKASPTQQALAVSGNCTATAGDFKLPTFFF